MNNPNLAIGVVAAITLGIFAALSPYLPLSRQQVMDKLIDLALSLLKRYPLIGGVVLFVLLSLLVKFCAEATFITL